MQPYLFKIQMEHENGTIEDTYVGVTSNSVSNVVHFVEEKHGPDVQVLEAQSLGWILVEE